MRKELRVKEPRHEAESLPKRVRKLLSELKSGLEEVYGNQLKGVYLFGSYARGEQDLESDLDVLIVLTHFDSYGREIDRTGELISNLSLKNNLTISRTLMQERDWLHAQTPLLRNVREEAQPV